MNVFDEATFVEISNFEKRYEREKFYVSFFFLFFLIYFSPVFLNSPQLAAAGL